jgi:CheY-like chemotaxis protein
MSQRKGTLDRKRPLVLVVDDFGDAREMYAEVLALAGFHVEEAENGVDAVAKAKRFRPGVIVMDLSLPIMDGWEATRLIKSNSRLQNIRVIAISAHSMAAHISRAREAGCDEFLAKPCLPDDLVDAVRRQIAGPDPMRERVG